MPVQLVGRMQDALGAERTHPSALRPGILSCCATPESIPRHSVSKNKKNKKKTRLDSATLLGYGRVYRELAGVGDRVQLAKDRLDR